MIRNKWITGVNDEVNQEKQIKTKYETNKYRNKQMVEWMSR